MGGDIFKKLYLIASDKKSLEKKELISEAIFLLKKGLEGMGIEDFDNQLKTIKHILDYRVHQYQRETGCQEPSVKTWVSIQKAFKEIYDREIRK